MPRIRLFGSGALRTWLCVGVIGSASAVWYWQQQKEKQSLSTKAETEKRTSDKEDDLRSAERAYVRQLARFLEIPETAGASPAEMLSLTANLHLRANQTALASFNAGAYPWLGPVPSTLATRELKEARSAPLVLGGGDVTLPGPFTLYQYSLCNTGDRPADAPLLFQDVRWDSAEGLLASTGLATIPDELDRAVAVWRFIARHRTHFFPPTEGQEEHDLIKFLSAYGYGLCDDSARAVAMLAELVGLRSRVCFLHGDVQVVAEIFANGRWRMFDADQMVYFHDPGAPGEVLGIEELSRDPQVFKNAVWLGPDCVYEEQYVRAFTHPDRQHTIKPTSATASHQIAFRLMPGERLVFGNFNWGRCFLGKYPHRVPRYLNGFIERPLRPDSFAKLPAEVRAESATEGFTLRNESDRNHEVRLEFESPFPIVGGRWIGKVHDSEGRAVEARLEDHEHRTVQRHVLNGELSLDAFVTLISKKPTTRWTLSFTVPARDTLHFQDCRVICDFQFSEFALARFQPGANSFHVHWPDGETKGWSAEIRFR